jgi:hypothetical protein
MGKTTLGSEAPTRQSPVIVVSPFSIHPTATPRRPDPNLVWEGRLDGVVGRIRGALWTANVDQLSALRVNMPRLADALDALSVVSKEKPTQLRPLIDDKRGT